MKILKLNSFTTFLVSITIIGLVIFLPIVIIESAWNSTIGKVYDFMEINFWQALILWLIVLTILNILGIFRFEFAIETTDSLDKEKIKKKIEGIQSKNQKSQTEDKKEDKA